jgi:HK97 family phage prohead protease
MPTQYGDTAIIAAMSAPPRGRCSLYDHRSDFLLGSVRAGNLAVEVRSLGLCYSVELDPETRSGTDVYQWVKSKIVTGSSFSFNVYSDDWDWVNGQAQRTLLSAKLIDLGPTAKPAYEAATATALRSLAENRGESFNDVESLWQQGELRKLFTTTSISPAVVPVAETRGGTMDLATARATLDSMKPRTGMNAKQAMIDLYAVKLSWDRQTPAEARRELAELRDEWAHESDPRRNPR